MKRREFIKGAGIGAADMLIPKSLKSLAQQSSGPNLFNTISHSANFKGAQVFDNQESGAIHINTVPERLKNGPVVVCFGWSACDTLCPQIHAALSRITTMADKNLTILVIDVRPSNDNNPGIGHHPESLLNLMYLQGVPKNAHILSLFPTSDQNAKNIQLDDFGLIGNRTDFYAHSPDILLFDGKTGNFLKKKPANQGASAFDEWSNLLKSRSR